MFLQSGWTRANSTETPHKPTSFYSRLPFSGIRGRLASRPFSGSRLDVRLPLKSGGLHAEDRRHNLPTAADLTDDILDTAQIPWTDRILPRLRFASGVLTAEQTLPPGILEIIHAYGQQNDLRPKK